MNEAKRVVGPSGQLVELARGATIKPGWREATAEDVFRAEDLELERRVNDDSGEHERRAAQAAASDARRSAVAETGKIAWCPVTPPVTGQPGDA